MKQITMIAALSLVGCAPKNITDDNLLAEQIIVTHKILIPGTNQYCEIDNDNHAILSCELYSETDRQD